MRTFIFLGRVVFTAVGLYAVYSAILGQWARATFFLVLYHLAWDMNAFIQKGIEERKMRNVSHP